MSLFSYASLAYSTQNLKRSKSSKKKVKLARLAPLSSVNDHEGSVLCVAFSHSPNDVLLASGGTDYALNVYSVRDSVLRRRWKESEAHNGLKSREVVRNRAISCVAFGTKESQNLLISGGFDAVIRVWSVLHEDMIFELRRHKAKIRALFVSEDGCLVRFS